MTKQQEHLLMMMNEIDDICKRHNIEYVLAGGTLIGAVRHRGFIPWDDDMDIMITRRNWEKFVEVCKKELPPNRALVSPELDRTCTNSFPRYMDISTTAIHTHQIAATDPAGEVIDILIMDPIPDDDKSYRQYVENLMIYSELVNPAAAYCSRWEVSLSKYMGYLLQTFILGKHRVLKKLEEKMFSYPEEKCNRFAMRWGGAPFIFPKEWVTPVKVVQFEHLQAMAPNEINDYLVWHYGDDWYYIPSHAKRESHNTVSNRNIDYTKIRSIYRPQIKPGLINFLAVLRKIIIIGTYKKRMNNQTSKIKLKSEFIKMSIDVKLKSSAISLSEWMYEHKWEELQEFFSEYYTYQLSAQFIGREDFTNIYRFNNPYFIEIDDETLYAALYTLIYINKISKALRLLEIRESRGDLTEKLAALKSSILKYREAVNLCEKGRLKESEKIIETLLIKYQNNLSFIKLKCKLMHEKSTQDGSYKELTVYLNSIIENLPKDGELLKYQGDIYINSGKLEEALFSYASAKMLMNNGMLILEIEDTLRNYLDRGIQNCKYLLQKGENEKAISQAELWMELLPDDKKSKKNYYNCKLYQQLNKKEYDDIMCCLKNDNFYSEVLQLLYVRMGINPKVAELKMKFVYAKSKKEEELIESILKKHINENNHLAESYKLLGDIMVNKGETKKGFVNYEKALMSNPPNYVKEEIFNIYMQDMLNNERFLRICQESQGNIMSILDGWLNKYSNFMLMSEILEKLCLCGK